MNQTELLNRLAFGAMLVGYFLNLVWMIDSDLTQASAILIIRTIGIVIPPIGVAMGFIPI